MPHNNKYHFTVLNMFHNKSITIILILFQSFFLSPLILSQTKYKYPQICLCYIILCLWLSNSLLIFWQFWTYNLLFEQFTAVIDIILIVIAYVSVIIESWTNRIKYIKVLHQIAKLDDIIQGQMENFHQINVKQTAECCRKVFCNFTLISMCQIIGMIFLVPTVKWTEYGFCLAKMGLYLRMLQISFYVDMIVQRLTYINMLLMSIQFDRNVNRIESVLMMIKNVYGKLWKIYGEINHIFGWSLVCINVEFMFNMICCMSLFYRQHNQSTKLTISEFNNDNFEAT